MAWRSEDFVLEMRGLKARATDNERRRGMRRDESKVDDNDEH